MSIYYPSSGLKSTEELIELWKGALIESPKKAVHVAKFGLLTQPSKPLTAFVNWPEITQGHVILEFCSSGMVTYLRSRKERFDISGDTSQFYIDNFWILAGLSNYQIARESLGIDDPDGQCIKLVEMLEQRRTSKLRRLFLPRFHLSTSFRKFIYGPTYGSNSIATLVMSPRSHHNFNARSMIIKLAEDLHNRYAVNLSPYRVTDLMQQMQELI